MIGQGMVRIGLLLWGCGDGYRYGCRYGYRYCIGMVTLRLKVLA